MNPYVGAALGAGVGLLASWPVTDGNLFDPFVPRGSGVQRCGSALGYTLSEPCPPDMRCQPGFLGGTCVGPEYDRNVLLARVGLALAGGLVGYLVASR